MNRRREDDPRAVAALAEVRPPSTTPGPSARDAAAVRLFTSFSAPPTPRPADSDE